VGRKDQENRSKRAKHSWCTIVEKKTEVVVERLGRACRAHVDASTPIFFFFFFLFNEMEHV
jgi:hypothetical protein